MSSAVDSLPRFDRGPRPYFRGLLHANAVWYFAGTGSALTVASFILHGSSALSWFTALYAVCLVAMLGVSGLYHRAPWRSEGAVRGWRRADHSMIAIFIAGTYGPVTVSTFDTFADGQWVLLVCWIAALVAVAINVFWIGHPRWLDVGIYLALGWLIIFKITDFAREVPTAAGLLIVIGGLIYMVGAISYGLKRPNFSERWFGFHEFFHATTVVAAGLHHVAIWLIVLES